MFYSREKHEKYDQSVFKFNNFRWSEAITYSKKGIRVAESGDVATLFSLYGRLIEAQVKSNCYEG